MPILMLCWTRSHNYLQIIKEGAQSSYDPLQDPQILPRIPATNVNFICMVNCSKFTKESQPQI